jgi:hypothetical protein
MVPGILELKRLAGFLHQSHTCIRNQPNRMELADLIYIAFLLICAWIAIEMSGPGGGKRQRMPVVG